MIKTYELVHELWNSTPDNHSIKQSFRGLRYSVMTAEIIFGERVKDNTQTRVAIQGIIEGLSAAYAMGKAGL